jgi:hypothetical protein
MMMSSGCVAGVPETGLRVRAFLSVCVSSSQISSVGSRKGQFKSHLVGSHVQLGCKLTLQHHHIMARFVQKGGMLPTPQQFYQQLLVAVNAVLRHTAYHIYIASTHVH